MRGLGCWSLLKAQGAQAARRPRALGPSELGFGKSECKLDRDHTRNTVPGDTRLWLPGIKRKLLEFQERERTESEDGGKKVGVRPRSFTLLAGAPSIQCPGLEGRRRPHAAHGQDLGAGSSTVDLVRHSESHALHDTDIH